MLGRSTAADQMLLAALVSSSVCRIRRSENPEGSQRRGDADAGHGAGAQPTSHRLVAAAVEL